MAKNSGDSTPRAFTHAFVRPPSRSLAECELLHLPRQPFDFDLAIRQHEGYVAALEGAGIMVQSLAPEPDLPDAVFVEDTVIMLDELAILCRPGALSRRAETAAIASEVRQARSLVAEIRAPGTIDGGDVLCIDRTLFVGRSTRTNAEAIRQLRDLVSPHGYEVQEVTVRGSLHLKTAVTSPGPGLLVANSRWADLGTFRDFEIIQIPEAEPWGANILPVNGRVFAAQSAPQTAKLIAGRGFEVRLIDVSELQKAEAGLTCLSVLFR